MDRLESAEPGRTQSAEAALNSSRSLQLSGASTDLDQDPLPRCSFQESASCGPGGSDGGGGVGTGGRAVKMGASAQEDGNVALMDDVPRDRRVGPLALHISTVDCAARVMPVIIASPALAFVTMQWYCCEPGTMAVLVVCCDWKRCHIAAVCGSQRTQRAVAHFRRHNSTCMDQPLEARGTTFRDPLSLCEFRTV